MRLPAQLLHRKQDSHKGDFGHIFVLAGSLKFSGAAVLCAHAAIRAGAGLVTLGIPKGLSSAIIKIKPKEIMLLPLVQTRSISLSISAYPQINKFSEKVNIFAVGPGIGQDVSTQQLIRRLIIRIDKPMVIDADGLSALSMHLSLLNAKRYALSAMRILTPHPGEMARLIGLSVSEVQHNREKIAQKFAKDYNLTLVLKGNQTVVADYNGHLYINKTGNPGMATAGSGDVLTGMIAGLWAQGLTAFEAAKYGVYLHGLAGDIAVKEKTQISLIASDIIDRIPAAIRGRGN